MDDIEHTLKAVQMYKIYINETPLILLNAESGEAMPATHENQLLARYTGKHKSLLSYLDMLEKSDRWQSVVIYATDYEKLVADFESLFTILRAAGGVVFNPQGQVLLIYRRGFWDLPKGKIDTGESIEAAALREVQEETGLSALSLGEAIATTHHVYRDKKGKRILKPTYWFKMETTQSELTPQAEEDIEQAVWTDGKKFLEGDQKTYQNIRNVLGKVFFKKD